MGLFFMLNTIKMVWFLILYFGVIHRKIHYYEEEIVSKYSWGMNILSTTMNYICCYIHIKHNYNDIEHAIRYTLYMILYNSFNLSNDREISLKYNF